ncbi:MAG: hypothetical protein V2I43_14795 [Parvularcula sp.]|nr:hypothetical protein [Parvularcula sp.]
MIRILLLLGLMSLIAGPAHGQSLSPMQATVPTFGEVGAVRVALRNPYASARRFEIELFDLDWQPLGDGRLVRDKLSLGPGGRTSVLALAPVAQHEQREIYLCATSSPFRTSSAGLRGQVCGRYTVMQRSFSP